MHPYSILNCGVRTQTKRLKNASRLEVQGRFRFRVVINCLDFFLRLPMKRQVNPPT